LEPQGREFLLASPKSRALVSNANSALLSRVKGVSLRADNVAYATSTPKDANKVPNREAGTKALSSANSLRRNAKNKAPLRATPLRAKSEVSTILLPKPSGANFVLGGGSTSIASSIEANTASEIALKSPVVKKRSLNIRVHQLEQPSTRSPRVSIQDHLSLS